MAEIARQTASVTVLSLNPSVDVSYEIPRLLADQKAHATATRYDPGGNGINVARALKELGLCAHTYGFIAGESGEFLLRLVKQRLGDDHFFSIQGETRINSTVLQTKPPCQYEFSAPGPEVSSEMLEKLCKAFVSAATGYAVLTGSVQPGVPATIYAELCRKIRGQGGFPVVDAHDNLLRHALTAHPFLIKPNRYELEMLINSKLPSLDDVAREACRLQHSGIDKVCVSLGPEGALIADDHACYYAMTPAMPVRCTVGAGDSMLAGLLAAFANRMSTEEALRLGIACGSATAMHPGTELLTNEEICSLGKQITVKTIRTA